MPLKTREELEEIYQNLIKRTTHVEAIQLLDSLQVEGAKWAAHLSEMVLEEKQNRWEYATNVSCKPSLAVLSALENREKI